MMAAEALKMKVIPVEKPPKSVFMELPEVIGLPEGIVSQLPIESFGDGGFARKLVARCGEGAEFFSEVRTQKLNGIKAPVLLWVNKE